MTEEQQEEVKLYDRWKRSKEKQILEEYAGRIIEEVPEEYREKISRLREFGLGKKEKTSYELIIEFLETHNGKLMQGTFRKNGKNLKREEMTEEQQEESKLYDRWINLKEKQILEEYLGRKIEELPEEYREKIAKLREFGLGIGKTTYEQVIEFLELHNGKLMSGVFSKDGKNLKREEMTEEQQEEVKLYDRWKKTKEKLILEEYVGRKIEEVPEEYREKIARLREFGLGKKEKTTYEQVIEFLEMHNGNLMKGAFYKDGKRLKREEITEEQQEEVKLYKRYKYR